MNRQMKWAAAAAIIVAIALAVGFWGDLGSPAYAIEQTAAAMHNIRFMHVVKRDQAGNIEDERWEEIDPNGYQARYRQNTPPRFFYVVDDRKTVMVYHASPEKNTVVLYDAKEESYTWHYAPGKMFDLAPLRTILSTGAPLSPRSFAWVYENVKRDLQLASISGGTDILSCFMLGCPLLPVYPGEIQCRGLGMKVETCDDRGRPVAGAVGDGSMSVQLVHQYLGTLA